MNEFERNEFKPTVVEGTRKGSVVSESSELNTDSYLLIPYGFQPKACYKPKVQSKEITGVTYNSRSRQFIVLDSKGIAAWSHNNIINSVSRLLDYPPYQFNLIKLLLHSKKFNVYFGLSKDYSLKVFNLNFHEVFSVVSDLNSVLCMVFNSVTDELITGGTGGIKFWTFGEIQSDERSMSKDSRPMANYGLILRREHPAVNGTMIKDIILDENNQRLYCLSERNVVAYDMKGNFLFELKSAHQGQVTGCVYSKYSNFVVTSGTDCAVNVWSSNGGRLHSFYSHSKMVTNLLLHPEAPSLVITSSQDGTIKIFSLDIMEEIYSLVVFSEGVEWMNFISQDLLYCATSKALQVFSINHVTNFWTTVRCSLRSISLTAGSHGNGRNVLAIADDYSARFLSKDGRLLSTVLPPPPVTAGQQSQMCSAHAYCPIYGLMYMLMNQEEVWVYYTKSNPANRVEVWKLPEIQDISCSQESYSRSDNIKSCTPVSSRTPQSSPSPFLPPAKIVDGVPCLSLAFLHSTVNLKNKTGECYTNLTYYLVLGLQDGRLLFTSPFSTHILYYQFQATKGAVLSIQHDENAGLLLLNTMTLDKYAVQIRGLPNLDLKHNIDAGNNLTCFAHMGLSFLTGHETGRINLYRLTSEQVTYEENTQRIDGQKISKDHLDAVLSLDANNNLQLFCSSSKDGSIKIWNNVKILLREIIMDKTLTMVCFLNSSGDLLVGFKNHLFSISREKVHLSSYTNSSRQNSEVFETGSDIYEDPRVRFEYKKVIPSEPVCMETYLVPFANISINLARFLSGQFPSNILENDIISEYDRSDSELSDVLSVAPTDIYMSQNGTPHSRSRSSSLVSSWNLPNIGSSPVSSPPRTPPPLMTPVPESESEDEIASQDDKVSEDNGDNYLANNKESGITQTSKNTVASSVFSRQKRAGLSEQKIDSRALQLKKSFVKATKKTDSPRSNRVKHESATSLIDTTKSRRPGRDVVKKTKKQTKKPQRRTAASKKPSFQDNVVRHVDEQQNDLGRNENYKKERNNTGESLRFVEERQLDEEDFQRQSTKIDGIENTIQLQENVSIQTRPDEKVISSEKEEDGFEEEHRNKTAFEEVLAVEDDVESTKDDLPDILSKDECSSSSPRHEPQSNDDSDIESERTEPDVNELASPRTLSREDLLTDGIVCLDLEESPQRLHSPCNSIHSNDNINSSNLSSDRISNQKESMTSLSDADDSDTPDTRNETTEKVVSKSVSFVIARPSDESKPREMLPTRSLPRRKISNRRSVSPVNVVEKVVPVLDSPPNSDTYGQRLHPNSALKIYALAKSRRRTLSSGVLVSRPRTKQRGFVKHNTSEASIAGGNLTTGDGFSRDIDGIPRTFVDIPPFNRQDRRGGEVIEETAKDKVKPKGKRDLMSWCVNALSEKAKYPIFSSKPRLRTQRSLLKDEEQSTSAIVSSIQGTKKHKNSTDNDVSFGRGAQNNGKYKRLDVFEAGNSMKSKSVDNLGGRWRIFYTEKPTLVNLKENNFDYGEGWQNRHLERTKERKAKYLERKRRVVQKQMVDKKALEEKRISVEPYGSRGIQSDKVNETKGIDRDNDGSWLVHSGFESPQGGPFWINMDKEDRINRDNNGHHAAQYGEQDLKPVKSSYENFRNNPVIIQPYRLGKLNTTEDVLLRDFDIDPQELPDHLLDFIPRPKSAPSIPSKCRKYVLVANNSETTRDRPAPTVLEEMLMLQRFPNSKIGQIGTKNCAPFISELRKTYSPQKLQNINMPCK